jgi:hypothetical protein
MKSKRILVLSTLILTLVLGMMMLRGGSTKAAMIACTVPGTHATIQAAINDVACSQIDVAPGAYTENLTIPRAVTLNGAEAGNPFSGRTFGSPGESTVSGDIRIQAANVTIDGFSLTNPGGLDANRFSIIVKTAGDNAVIKNNIIDSVGSATNTFFGGTHAIYLETGPDGVKILDNSIRNVQHAQRTSSGIFIGDSASANQSQNVLIAGNSISQVITGLRGAYGVIVNNGAGTPGLQILNNSIHDLTGGGWVHAIGLEGNTPGVIVADNTVTNIVAPGADRLAVWFEANPSYATGQVHNNNLDVTTLAFGIAVHPALPAGPVSGTCNWWGSASGPTAASNPGGTGSQVSPNVAYKPWLISSAPGAACIGGNVVTNKNQCKDDGWQTRVRANNTPFKNQGDCIQYANTGK